MLRIYITIGLILQALIGHCTASSFNNPAFLTTPSPVNVRSKTEKDGFCLINILAFKDRPISELRKEIRDNLDAHNGKIRLGRIGYIGDQSIKYLPKDFSEALIKGFSTPGLLDGIKELSVVGLEIPVENDGVCTILRKKGSKVKPKKIVDTTIRSLMLKNISRIFFEAITVPRTFKILEQVRIREHVDYLERVNNFKMPESEFTGKSILEIFIDKYSSLGTSIIKLGSPNPAPILGNKYAKQAFPTHINIESMGDSLEIQTVDRSFFGDKHVLLYRGCITETTIATLWMDPPKTLQLTGVLHEIWAKKHIHGPRNVGFIAKDCLVLELDDSWPSDMSADQGYSFMTSLKSLLDWIKDWTGNPRRIIILVDSSKYMTLNMIQHISNSSLGLPTMSEVILLDPWKKQALNLSGKIYTSEEHSLQNYISPDMTPFLFKYFQQNPPMRRL